MLYASLGAVPLFACAKPDDGNNGGTKTHRLGKTGRKLNAGFTYNTKATPEMGLYHRYEAPGWNIDIRTNCLEKWRLVQTV